MAEETTQSSPALNEFRAAMLEMKTLVKAGEEERAKFGKTTEETGKKLDAVDKRFDGLAEAVKADNLKLTQRLDQYEASRNAPGFAAQGIETRSVGEQFIASSQYGDAVKAHIPRTEAVAVSMERRDLSSGASSVGALITPQRISVLGGSPVANRVRLRDIIPTASTSTGVLEFPRRTGYSNLYTEIATQTTSGSPVVVVDSTAGMYAGQIIAVNGVSKVILTVDTATQITLTTNVGATVAVDAPVTSALFTGTAELAKKPKGNLTTELITRNVKTLAHWIAVSRQAMDDSGQLRQLIDQLLLDGLGNVEDEQILYGAGTAQQLNGLLTETNRQTRNWSDGIATNTQLDALRLAMADIAVTNESASHVLLHPTDWAQIEMIKGSDGHYVHGLVSVGADSRLWRVPVVEVTALRVGEALVGALTRACTLWDRQQSTIRVADQHAENFTENTLAVLAEERLALTTYTPEAIVHVTFDGAPGTV